jgi:hypothetical protein
LQRVREIVDRLLYRFGKLTDTRRAAVLGIMFGLLMCVLVLTGITMFGFILALAD